MRSDEAPLAGGAERGKKESLATTGAESNPKASQRAKRKDVYKRRALGELRGLSERGPLHLKRVGWPLQSHWGGTLRKGMSRFSSLRKSPKLLESVEGGKNGPANWVKVK